MMHEPVLLEECMELLDIKADGTYVDGTLGGGGHAEAILSRLDYRGRLLGIDRDQEAIARAGRRLGEQSGTYHLEHGNFADMMDLAERHDIKDVDGVLLDLGMSSYQVDDGSRGFSFMHEGPLDMRMDTSRGPGAKELVNEESVESLINILQTMGEERSARRVAKAIDEARSKKEIETTTELAELVERAKGGRRGKTHPATQTFQALRMAVNNELGSAEQGIYQAIELVRPGGRVAVISFHSVEDRIVKHCFARHIGKWQSLQEGGQRWLGEEPAVKKVTNKPVTASVEEVSNNPRARSAKLRVVERIR